MHEIAKLSSKEQDAVIRELFKTRNVHELFNLADQNKDGTISKAEFQTFVETKWQLPFNAESNDHTGAPEVNKVASPSWTDLRQLMLCTALPFVGFGFLDNFIMLSAGDWIESSIGSSLHLSTLAAAALGNTVSDVAGLSMGGIVERISRRVGVRAPKLSRQQLRLTKTRLCVFMGSTSGITFGCILGMVPLIFID